VVEEKEQQEQESRGGGGDHQARYLSDCETTNLLALLPSFFRLTLRVGILPAPRRGKCVRFSPRLRLLFTSTLFARSSLLAR
jgi:hypothetical protein